MTALYLAASVALVWADAWIVHNVWSWYLLDVARAPTVPEAFAALLIVALATMQAGGDRDPIEVFGYHVLLSLSVLTLAYLFKGVA